MSRHELQLKNVPIKIAEGEMSEQSGEVRTLLEELDGLKAKIQVLQGNVPCDELTSQYILLAEILQQEKQYSKSLQAETETLRNNILERLKMLEADAQELCQRRSEEISSQCSDSRVRMLEMSLNSMRADRFKLEHALVKAELSLLKVSSFHMSCGDQEASDVIEELCEQLLSERLGHLRSLDLIRTLYEQTKHVISADLEQTRQSAARIVRPTKLVASPHASALEADRSQGEAIATRKLVGLLGRRTGGRAERGVEVRGLSSGSQMIQQVEKLRHDKRLAMETQEVVECALQTAISQRLALSDEVRRRKEGGRWCAIMQRLFKRWQVSDEEGGRAVVAAGKAVSSLQVPSSFLAQGHARQQQAETSLSAIEHALVGCQQRSACLRPVAPLILSQAAAPGRARCARRRRRLAAGKRWLLWCLPLTRCQALRVVELQHLRDEGEEELRGPRRLTLQTIISALNASLESYQQDALELQVVDDVDDGLDEEEEMWTILLSKFGHTLKAWQMALVKERQRCKELQEMQERAT
eukprot:761841-Hanusia_phi.AAC.11